MSKEAIEAHEERIGVSDSTRRERESWIETLREAIKSGLPKHVRNQAEQAIAGIEKSIRFGGTRLLRERMADLEIERDALLAERDVLKAEQALWEPIHYEIHRRAEKQWCLSSQCDFEVTVTYEDYAAIDAALQGAQP